MTTVFPTSIDSLPRPGSGTYTDDSGFELDVVLDNISDAIEAIETKLGTGTLIARAKLASARQAKVRNSANQSLTNATFTALTFDTEDLDTDAFHSTVSNTSRLTAPFAGKFLVYGAIGFASNTTGYRMLQILQDGATALQVVTAAPVNGADTYLTAFTVVALTAGQYVELRGLQTSGGALNSVFNAGQAPAFGMIELGP